MRTRNQAKRQPQSTGGKDNEELLHDPESNKNSRMSKSGKGVCKLLKQVSSRGSSRSKKRDDSIGHCESINKPENELKGTKEQVAFGTSEAESSTRDEKLSSVSHQNVEVGNVQQANTELENIMDELEWEDGSIPILESRSDHPENKNQGITIEFDASPGTAKRKPVRRASAEEKELAELVHRVHLLCLLGRGRIIDAACNDPLIQASLLSLLPTHLLKISDVSKLTVNALTPLVNWFHNNFRVGSPSSTDKSFLSALAYALENREGTPEEVAALSVAFFRALNFSTRFVSILDVASLKPDGDKSESISQAASSTGKGIFKSSTVMVDRTNKVSKSSVKHSAYNDVENVCETSKGSCKSKVSKLTDNISQHHSSSTGSHPYDKRLDSLASEVQNYISDLSKKNISQHHSSSTGSHPYDKRLDSLAGEVQNYISDLSKKTERSKRKGDLEFEMQLQMALSATGVGTSESNVDSDVKDLKRSSSKLSPFKKLKILGSENSSSSSQGISTAVGSRKIGPPLFWAEVYCSGENLTGKWVHVDSVTAIIDEEQKVEAAAAACKTSLRYAVAFAGLGAKDVTRRYCAKWYKIASQRVNPSWWDAVLAPLKDLESGATGGVVHLRKEALNKLENVEACKLLDPSTLGCSPDLKATEGNDKKNDAVSLVRSSFVATRTSLEDMELETKTLTEPLPTNQQAYRSHHLYALERWLTKYQILHPKGPVLGFCSGHPVYPRTCVQELHTKERWLREGLQIKGNELPVKELKRSQKLNKSLVSEADDCEDRDCEGPGGTIILYGKWQTEPLCLPHAVNGIVPKNERGQVDVWSEKCLPPGTVHLGLPRVFTIAKRLEIDYASAMVGFEFRNGRSYPVYNGIVVCAEFKDAILEAYGEEEERRLKEERRKDEAQAISRWYQLLSSIVTRQRLKNRYGDGALSAQTSNDIQTTIDKTHDQINGAERQNPECQEPNASGSKADDIPQLYEENEEHEHVFLMVDQSFDFDSSTWTKRCRCGFSIEVEEM